MRRSHDVNYYAVLGVLSSASRDEIKAAYRVAVRTAHPDAGGDHDQFAVIAEAWEVLGDPASRVRYDADRRLALRASRPYMTRLDRNEVRDGVRDDARDDRAAGGGDAEADGARKAAAQRRANDPEGATDAQRWLRDKRRL